MAITRLWALVSAAVLLTAAIACAGDTQRPAADPTATTAAPSPTPRVAAPTPTEVAPTSTSVPPEPEATATPALFPFSVQDSEGGTVTFDVPPERIVAYDGAAVETLFRLSHGDKIVATHEFVTYPPETAGIPKVGGAFNIDVEAVVALEPDLVFIFYPTFNEQLRNAGLKVLYIQSLNNDFRKVADGIRLWGDIMGTPEEADALAEEFLDRVDGIEDSLASETGGTPVFYDTGDLWTPGPDTLVGEVLKLLKLENVAAEVSGYAQLSPEVIVAQDPEIIFTGCPECFTGDAAFSDVTAVASGAIYPTSRLLSVAGPRFVDGITELAGYVYPDTDF